MAKEFASDMDLLEVEMQLAASGLRIATDMIYREANGAILDKEACVLAKAACQNIREDPVNLLNLVEIYLDERLTRMRGAIEKEVKA